MKKRDKAGKRPFFCKTRIFGRARYHSHADSDGLSVAESRIMVKLFKRMAERMAEIQEHPLAGFVLVALDNPALDIDALVNDIVDFFFYITTLKLFKQGKALNTAIFDNLRHAV